MNFESNLPPAMVLKYLNSRKEELANVGPNSSEMRTIAHKMRGNAATFGLPQLGTIAGKIEDVFLANQKPDSSSLEQLTNQLKLEVDSLISQSTTSV